MKSKANPRTNDRRMIERVQTGFRIEKRIAKVLKALAEYYDMGPGELLEGILLHVFEGKNPFTPESLKRIEALKKIYGLDLKAGDSHLLLEKDSDRTSAKA
jgi:hypothetical protein